MGIDQPDLSYSEYDPYANPFGLRRLRLPRPAPSVPPRRVIPGTRPPAAPSQGLAEIAAALERRGPTEVSPAQRPALLPQEGEVNRPPSIAPPGAGSGEPEPSVPKPTVSAETSTQTGVVPAQTDDSEIDRTMALFKKYNVMGEQDPYEIAKKHITEPKKPGPFNLGPWEVAALVAPALLGGTEGAGASGALLGGLLKGRMGEEGRYEAGLSRYEKQVTDIADRIERAQTRRAQVMGPYISETVHQREADRLAKTKQDLQRSQIAFSQQLQGAKLAWEEYKFDNLSAQQREAGRIRNLEVAIRQHHEQWAAAIAQGRLSEADRHNHEVERLTEELRTVERTRLQIAVDKAKTGGLNPNQTAGLFLRIQTKIGHLEDSLAIETDPKVRAELENEVGKWRGWASALEKKFGTVLSETTTGTPTGQGAGTITDAEIQQIAQNTGKTVSEVEAEAKAKGYRIIRR